MARPFASILFALVFVQFLSSAQETLHYPAALPPRVSFERLPSNRIRFSVDANTNVLVDLLQANTLAGPWNLTPWEQDISASSSFFQARVNPSQIRNGPYSTVSTTFFAIRMADAPPTEFTTTNSFHLTLEVTNWYDGISIYYVDDGPSTGDLAADFDRLMRDLNEDARTQFISTTNPTRATFGEICYTGGSDSFQISKTTSTNLNNLSNFDLIVIDDQPTYILVRWTKAKSMDPESFQTKLKTNGLDAFQITLGCAV